MTTKEVKNSKPWWMIVAVVLLLIVTAVGPVAADNPWNTGLIPGVSYYNYTLIPTANQVRFLPYPDTNQYEVNLTMFNGTAGQNAIHISNSYASTSGQCTNLPLSGANGTFYVTDTGGRGYQDNIILLIGVASDISSDRLNAQIAINASGYNWTPHAYVENQGPFQGEPIPAVTKVTVTSANYSTNTNGGVYQIWKFAPDPNYPMYCGQNMNSSLSQYEFNWTAVDLKMGIVSNSTYNTQLNNYGMIQINYNITKSGGFTSANTKVAFNVYAFNRNTTQGVNQTLWINRVNSSAQSPSTSYSGWLVRPKAAS